MGIKRLKHLAVAALTMTAVSVGAMATATADDPTDLPPHTVSATETGSGPPLPVCVYVRVTVFGDPIVPQQAECTPPPG